MTAPAPPRTDAGARPARWTASLRVRLLGATLIALAAALGLSGIALSRLFHDHVQRQFETTLIQQLDQLTARLEFDAAGQPLIDSSRLSDPRWGRPYSGLYWQVDEMPAQGATRRSVLRSRSLWDSALRLDADAMTDGAVHVHELAGPQDQTLLVIERSLRQEQRADTRWRLMVAADLRDTQEAIQSFTGMLAVSLAVLFALLALAAWAQVVVGLRPMRGLQRSLDDVRQARSQRLEGSFPREVQPLVDGFNQVLARNAEVVQRARTQAGNLAHALKTPLSILDHAAAATASDGLARQVREQVGIARRHIDWHLARSRVAATQRLPGQRTDVGRVAEGLIRVMQKVHADRALTITLNLPPDLPAFAGEEQDLQEMLGNLLDNACKWAKNQVWVRAELPAGAGADQLCITVEDDGPGIAPADLAAVKARGVRLDESVPGSGLGLAIVQNLADLYEGQISLALRQPHGLAATLCLPALVA
ncbi:MAG: sensor histidine kinase [Burkholderiaceae bacterium]|nr:sensor histidine kinase [Burkholderiaceae bacterium]